MIGIRIIYIAVLVLTAVFCVWVIGWPWRDVKNESKNVPSVASAKELSLTSENQQQIDVTSFAWNRKMRQFGDGMAIQLGPPPAKAERPNGIGQAFEFPFRLVATIYEPGHSFAAFEDEQGNVDLQPEGGNLRLEPQGVQLKSVRRGSVVLEYAGKTQELLVEREETQGSDVVTGVNNPAKPVSETDSINEPADPEFDNIDQELDWLSGDEDWEDNE